MKLIFVRHGQTDFNKNKIPMGREIDASINETGIKQAEAVATRLPNNIDFIISSPLKRAMKTAEIINKVLNKSIEFNDELMEYKYGSLSGKTWPEIETLTKDEDAYQHDLDIVFDYRKFGGDSSEDLKSRVLSFVNKLKIKYPDKTILLVTHGGVIDAMRILFSSKEEGEAANGSIFEFNI